MLLNHQLLTTFQRCKRRYALERDWKVDRWRPRQLFEKLWREAIFVMSNGAKAEEAAQNACTLFLEQAARPGLDILTDPYTIARDYCSIFCTSLEAVSRAGLLSYEPPLPVTIGDHAWQTSAFRDESGLLHAWFAVERWDRGTMAQKLHSWEVFGDCAANQVGMTLHVIEIGRMAGGHQHTPWARIYAHPAIHGHHRFQQVDGTKLEGSWKPKWYQDSDKNNASDWVDMMEADNVVGVRTVEVKELSKEHVEQFCREVKALAYQMTIHDVGTGEHGWQDMPMSRPSCDIPPCPWQDLCYCPSGVTNIKLIGLYSRRVLPPPVDSKKTYGSC